MLKTYLKRIFEVAKREDATEESYYSSLEELLKDYAASINKKNTHVTTIPKKTEAGNPDFRVWDGKQHIVGYIEAKAPTVEYLDQIETTEQLKRYLHTFPNLILTNFFEFRLYRDEILIDKVVIGRPYHLHKLKSIPPVEKESEFLKLLEKFFSFSLPKKYTAKSLAIELAKRTRFLKEQVIAEELKEESEKGKGLILEFYKAFQTHLIGTLTQDDFADLYSQTITYGLFAARTRTENGFNRKLAYDSIPRTIGILREVFKFISLGDLPTQMEWIVDDISDMLAAVDVQKILHDFYHKGKGKDPIVHFYETFLAEYDPKERAQRGVYYTPEPVVSYIVSSLHYVLKQRFDKDEGFASSSVTVLDPAAGTLTFLAEASKLAIEEFTKKYGEAGKKDLIKEHILKNFYAFELMMAPYAVGHLKMSFLMEEFGYKLRKDDRFKLYLTNTLEMEDLAQSEFPGMSSLAEESRLAGNVKKKTPVLVIMGNPPYSVSSINKSRFIEKEMELYKKDVRDERNIQPLSDDYIKFIRFAHWKIEKEGKGIIGMITNNSYLSGLIHRGVRKKLLESFNEIYVLNLHGNSRIGEKSPDGSSDENVFDIQQGVSIALFIKNKKHKGLGKVFYEDVYGLREKKYVYLDKHDIDSTKWKELKPSEPHYFFVEKDFSLQENYNQFTSIQKIFNNSSSGVTTHRDHFVVGFTKEEVKQRMRTFTSNLPDELVRQSLTLKGTSDFNIKQARDKMKKKDWQKSIIPYSYRPFDNRYICYLEELIDRNRYEVMQHFLKDNLSLVVMRQYLYDPVKIYNYVLCANEISDRRLFISNRGAGFVFPLYLYPKKSDSKKGSLGSNMMLFEPKADYIIKKPNLSNVLLEQLTTAFKQEPIPEQIFFYIYAVLYSNIYRTKYSEFLKIEFPKVPFTKDFKLFHKMSDLGKELTELHLLKSKALSNPISKFQGDGTNIVEKPKYNEKEKKVFINKERYFEGIVKDVWEYQIGGYQILDKWLKDRKGRRLTLDDIRHYCKIVTALKKTIEIQKKIDKLYPQIEKVLIEFEK
ncbi:MAG: type ISP restriction/modification enzyme [Candidatus Scalinduaceae bacterium]